MNWMELKEDSMLAGASPKVAARARFVIHAAANGRQFRFTVCVQTIFDRRSVHSIDLPGNVFVHHVRGFPG